MEYEEQLKVQACLDGELPEPEAREAANRLARDPEAAALMKELRMTRQALVGFEAGLRVPESREFYWSKIQRQIERAERPAPEPAAAVPWLVGLRRFLAPAAAVAMLVFGGLVVVRHSGTMAPGGMETTEAGAFTYRDYAAGATLVWLSYPAENEFALEGSADTLK
jgi:anti-sigma factor RsiW